MKFNVCMACKRPIYDLKSLSRCYGPECWSKLQNALENDTEVVSGHLPFDFKTKDIIARRIPSGDFDWNGKDILIPITNVPHVIHSHSSGFEWGYGGSGPAEFALNIMEAFFRFRDDEIDSIVELLNNQVSFSVWHLHQDFKEDFLVKMPKSGAVILGEDIERWIDSKQEFLEKKRVELIEEPLPFPIEI